MSVTVSEKQAKQVLGDRTDSRLSAAPAVYVMVKHMGGAFSFVAPEN